MVYVPQGDLDNIYPPMAPPNMAKRPRGIRAKTFTSLPRHTVFQACGLEPASVNPPSKSWITGSMKMSATMWEAMQETVENALFNLPTMAIKKSSGTEWVCKSSYSSSKSLVSAFRGSVCRFCSSPLQSQSKELQSADVLETS